MKKYILLAVLIGLAGCSGRKPSVDNSRVETTYLEAKEGRVSHFFETFDNFTLSESQVAELETVLRDMKAHGETNIGIALMSSKIVPDNIQEKAKQTLRGIMYRHGFLDSRIVDSGLVMYETAKTGIRVDVLKYKTKSLYTGLWRQSPGDHSIHRDLPQYGVATASNFGEMIANTADVISPRKYKGQKAADAIAAIGSSSGGSSSSSSSSSN